MRYEFLVCVFISQKKMCLINMSYRRILIKSKNNIFRSVYSFHVLTNLNIRCSSIWLKYFSCFMAPDIMIMREASTAYTKLMNKIWILNKKTDLVLNFSCQFYRIFNELILNKSSLFWFIVNQFFIQCNTYRR